MGDAVVLAIGARNLDHSCDLTAVDLTITETGKDGRVWDLARDVADTIQEGNPHADKHGNKDVWRFAKGQTRPPGASRWSAIRPPRRQGSPGSVLAQWRKAPPIPGTRPARQAGRASARRCSPGPGPRRTRTRTGFFTTPW